MADPLEPREPESREPSTIADAFAAMLACLAALLGEREAWTSAMIRALRDLVTRAAEEHARERPDIDAEDLWTDYRTERGTVTSDERRAFLAGVEAGRRTTRPSDEPRRTRIGGRHIWIADYKRQADDAPPPLRVLYNCKDEPDETREHAASAIVLQDIARSVDHLTGPRGSHLPPPRLTLPGLTAVMTLEALGGAATRCELHEAGKRPRRVRSARLVVDGLEVFAETSRDVEGAPVAAALDPSPRTEARERLGRIVREEWIARSVREQTAVQDAVELHRYEQALDKVAAAVREAWAHRGETAPAPSKPVDRERGRPYAPEIERAILPHVVAALRRMRAVASDPHDSARFALKTIEDAVDNARKMLDAGRLDGAIDILADVEPEADDDSAADPKAGQS